MKKHYISIIIVLFFIFFSVILNFSNWQEIFSKINSKGNSTGDSSMAEFILENNYQQVIHGKNPLIIENQIFYPFNSVNISLNDPSVSNTVFALLFRPLLDSHKSLIALLLTNIFLNNLLMYLLLRKLKISTLINVIISLSFGYVTILSYRFMGHVSYTSIYIFPLVLLNFLKILEAKSQKTKNIFSLILGLLMTFVILLNFYYFIGIFLGFSFYLFYFYIFDRKHTIKIFLGNIQYLLVTLTAFIISLIPWFLSVYSLVKSDEISKTKIFAGAIELSGDLAGFFTPSEYNPIFNFIFSKLANQNFLFTKFLNFYTHNIAKFNYAGLIVIFSYIMLIFLKKKLPQEVWEKMRPHFLISLLFAILTLGPFLKIFNHWLINLDGVSVVFPLPFLFFRYLPGLSSLRAPTRFTPLFVFLALIASAFLLDYSYKNFKGKKLIIFTTLLFILLFVDLYVVFPKQTSTYFPLRIYKSIAKEKNNNTVLEIPFTVRDGLQYIGYVHAITVMNGQLIHGKPVIGGYIARVPDKIFNYYQNLKFIEFVTKIIDKGNFDPLKEKPKEVKLYPYPYSNSSIEQEMNLLNIKYIILKNDEKYSDYLFNLFKRIGFIEKQKDNNYLLLEK